MKHAIVCLCATVFCAWVGFSFGGNGVALAESGAHSPKVQETQSPAGQNAGGDNAPDLGGMMGLNVETIEAVPPLPPAEDSEEFDGPRPVAEGPGGKINYVERSEDSQLLVEVALEGEGNVFHQSLPIYQADDTTLLLPLGQFIGAIGFPVTVDPAAASASGWFLKPENTFQLSPPFEFVEIAGKKIPVSQPGIVEAHLDDIYVSQDLLMSWFPIGLTLNYGELRLYVKALADLPVQERSKRHDRWEISTLQKQRRIGSEVDTKDMIRLPDHKITAPGLDVQHSVDFSRGADTRTLSTNTSVNGAMEIYGMDGKFNLGFTGSSTAREELNNLSFTLSKEDFGGTLLGSLKATKYEIGDVSALSFPLTSSGSGRGFTLTNQPFNFISDATKFRLTGFAPAGWDIEVFQGGELLAFETIGGAGEYDFATLPLKSGFNLFKIVLYGPHGEKEERFEKYYLGQDMVPEGKIYYGASALQSLTPLLSLGVTRPEETPPLLTGFAEYGIKDNLSVSAGVFHGQIADDIIADGVGLGLRGSNKSAYAQLNTFLDKSGGHSLSALVAGNLTETSSYTLQHDRHRKYEPGAYSILRKTTGSLSYLFDFKKETLPDINVTLGAETQTDDDGVSQLGLNARIFGNFFGMNVANAMERTTFSDGTSDNYTGTLTVRGRTRFGLLHSEWDYLFYPDMRVTNGKISLQSDLTRKVNMTNSLERRFGADKTDIFNTSIGLKLDKVSFNLSGEIDNKRSRQVMATVAYNLVPRALYGDYTFADIDDTVTNGRLLVRPFVDYNDNDKFDKGEPVVKDLLFRNMLRGIKSIQDKDGIAMVAGLTPSLANRIILDERSVKDIYLVAKKKELVVLGKTGVNGPIDFPFSKLGSISGTLVAIGASGGEVELSDVRMILLDKNGKEVTDTYSESDGFFSFDSVPVSSYEIFFPASDALAPYYQGSGEGPALQLTRESPELTGVKIVVEPTIIYEGGKKPVQTPATTPATLPPIPLAPVDEKTQL